MTNDTFHSYTYDAEGNITQVDGGSTATYVYDVFNHRIHVQTASATTEFTYDYAGRRVSSWLSPNNFGNEGRIYWDGQQFAYRSTDGTTYFEHQDVLGTERMRSNYAGSVGSSYVSLPWGDGYTATVNSSGADQDNAHFADLERDAESGTEHAQFRNYTSRQGRWLAPDQYAGSYDITNPQSMNRYAYVLNNPTSMLDPSGLNWQYNASDGCWDWGDSTVVNGVETASVTNGCSANPGCIAYGTEGCIQAPISVSVNPGEPGSVPVAPLEPPAASKQACISPNFAQSLAIKLLSEVASLTGRTVGYGVGGSVGAGKGNFGFNFGASQQLVVAPDGTAGLATSYTKEIFGVASQGVGGILGIQLTASTVQTVMDLEGYSVDAGGLAADGFGASGDATFSAGNSGIDMGLTGTFGYGFGGFGHAGSLTQTVVNPFCAN